MNTPERFVHPLLTDARISPREEMAIQSVIAAGRAHGYGNLIAWLATAWAMELRESGLSDESAVLAVSSRSPYYLPPRKPTPAQSAAILSGVSGSRP